MTLHDARDLRDGEEVRADICIVGAGPAGITLARELRDHGIDVLLLEGGGLDRNPRIQALYDGEVEGRPYFPLDVTRVRQLGGATNHWEGYCRPLDEADVAGPPLVEPLGAWPIPFRELQERYAEASRLCEIEDSLDYTGEAWAEHLGGELLPTDPDVMRSEVLLRSPPTNFGERYRDDLIEAGDIRVLLHANVVDLVGDEQRVGSARIAHFDGTTQLVSAETFVLATGGIEVPRLLLASTGADGVGIGNRHDRVGRYFMEHPHLTTPHLVTDQADEVPFYTEEPETQGTRVRGIFTVPPELREDRGTGNVAVLLMDPAPLARDELVSSPSTDGVRELLRAMPGVSASNELRVQFISEQIPNARSRVQLTATRDELGMPRCSLRWELHPIDHHTLRVASELAGGQLAANGLGRLNSPTHDGPLEYRLQGGHHHMGTTRMSEDPRHGVVDPDCRVHGVENLYIASSSVFPTGGFANPTLTIVALTLRLAAHLREGR